MMTSNVYKFAGMSPRMHNPHIRRHQFRSIKDIKMKILPYIYIFHVLLGLNFQVDILILRRMVRKNVKVLVFFTHPLGSVFDYWTVQHRFDNTVKAPLICTVKCLITGHVA